MRPGATLVFLDANILYSRTLRDWFALISKRSGAEGIRLRCSEDVLAEWLYHWRRKHPERADAAVGGLRTQFLRACPDAVIAGYEISPALLEGGDTFDAHVVAAASHGGVDYLVTSNLADFESLRDHFEFEIYAPDDLLCLILERRPDAVRKALLDNIAYWSAKPGSKDVVEALIDAGAPNFADGVRGLRTKLAMTGRY